MKKIISALLALVLALSCAAAMAEIKVNKKELSQNKALDKNVTNILVLLQDGDVTRTMILGSVNGRTGHAVIGWLNPQLMVDVSEAPDAPGMTALCDIYALGAKGSRGLLAVKKVNELLNLNIGTYVALDMSALGDIADAVGGAIIDLDPGEALAMGMPEGETVLQREDVLRYAQIVLDEDTPGFDRCYIALFGLLDQAVHGDMGKLMGAGQKLLAKMDTNLGIMSAMSLAGSAQAGADYDEIDVPPFEMVTGTNPLVVDVKELQDWLYKEIYEK